MTVLADARLVVAAPEGWLRVPNDRVPGLAGGRPGIAFVFAGDREVVQAWAFLRLLPRTADSPEAAVEAAAAILGGPVADAAAADGRVAVWHRDVRRTEVAEDPALVLTDLLVVDRGEGVREAQRRAIVVRYPPEPVAVHLTVSTPSSTVFADLGAAALEFAAAVDLQDADV